MRISGFTIAELLIALAILGVIATFTIPKVLQSQQSTRSTAVAKETIAMISGAFEAYKRENKPLWSTGATDLTPYMNYIKRDTVTRVDNRPGIAPDYADCSDTANHLCLRLANGAIIYMAPYESFANTAPTSAMWFKIDTNGQYDAAPSGQALNIWLYNNGRLTSYCCIEPNTYWGGGGSAAQPDPAKDPIWFTWN